MITAQDIIKLMVGRVASTAAADLVSKCKELGMRQVPYKTSLDSVLPPFDVGHHFRFNLDGGEEALFEILEKDTLVLQAGCQLFLPASFFSSKSKRTNRQLREIIEAHYGGGQVVNMGVAKGVCYEDSSTVAYISRAKIAGVDVVTVRVGNRRFWD